MSIIGKGNNTRAQSANDTTNIDNETDGRFDRGRKYRRDSRMALPLGLALLRAECYAQWAGKRRLVSSTGGKKMRELICCRLAACHICIFATSFLVSKSL